MAFSKGYGVLALAAICSPAAASSIGVDFLDANLFKRLELASKGPKSFTDWIVEKVTKRVNVVGTEYLALHLDKTTGDQMAYQNETAFGQGGQTFTNTGAMTVQGNKVADLFSFNLAFADNSYQDPSSRRFSLDYAKKGVAIDVGNIYASLIGGNQFLSFRRQLWGGVVHINKGPLSVAALVSQQKSAAVTTSFPGNNSSGPYFLGASELDPNSVRVQVDGKELSLGTDYNVNAIIGSITFNTLSVAPTSTIAVSYETTGINAGGGTVTGAAASYTLPHGLGIIGGMEVRQTDPTATGLTTYVDRYQGFGDPSVPYFLQYTPLASMPIVVTLDGINQVLNVDYQFSATNPTVFYFLRYVPTTSTITVTYTPSPSTNLRGTRQVEGFNYTFPFGRVGRGGSITYSEAFSQLDNPITPLKGVARGVVFNYKFKNFNFSGVVDDIPNSFVGIDSTGFQRNERSSTLNAEYKVGHLTLNATGANAAIQSEATDANGNLIFEPSRTTRLDAGAKYRGDGGLTWSFDQQHLTSWSIEGPSRADESTFSLAKTIGRLNSHLDLSHTQGFGPISNGVSSSLGDVRLDSIGWRGDYLASRGWNIGGHITESLIDTGGQHGKGTDTQMNLGYRPSAGKFGFDAAYTYSNSGEIATLGSFQDGTGLGFNGNGFSGGFTPSNLGINDTNSFNSTGTDVRRFQISSNYTIGKRANLGGNLFTTSEAGAISTNSNTTGGGFSFDYDMHNGQRASLSLDQSSTVFADSAGSATSLALNGFVGGRPKGPWSYRLGFGTLLSSGGTVGQNSFHYEISLKHYLKHNQAIGFDILSSSLTNYEPQNDFQVFVSYEHQLFKNVSLLGKYQIHTVTNLDPTVTAGAFDSRGFDIQMNFNFGS